MTTTPPVLDRRRAGVLLHARSLPSGRLDDAPRFLDFIADCGFGAWQLLPLGPSGAGRSPYSLLSAFAGDPDLVPLVQRSEPVSARDLGDFREREADWLPDFALFCVIRQLLEGQPWWRWPPALRLREPAALQAIEYEHRLIFNERMREQFRFQRCWQALRAEAAARDIILFGDLPMFVMTDSADVWMQPQAFRLDALCRPTHVAGVPPDAYAEHGQCWDCPVYDWRVMQDDGFRWWQRRLTHELRRFDLLRWDHFRGLAETWEIPVPAAGGAADPAAGAWRPVPGRTLLEHLSVALGRLPLVAENLGLITSEVERLRHDFGLPGMHVLQFAFDGDPDNPHLPGKHEQQGVAYSGTHDNDTTAGWCRGLDADTRSRAVAALGCSAAGLPEAVLRAALESACALAVLPLQDLLGLGSAARLNTPGRAQGQWRWQFRWQQLSAALTEKWRQAARRAGRQAA